MSVRLIVDLVNPGECPETIGLLIPVAPTTEHQSLDEITVSGADVLDRYHSTEGQQEVLMVMPQVAKPVTITYDLDDGDPTLSQTHQSQASYTPLPDAIVERLQNLLDDTATASERERLIIAFAAEHFSYGPPAKIPLTEQILCGLASGNCIDINSFLISAMLHNGIPACYFAGYYFLDRDRLSEADGMHCWISTYVEDEQHYWDLPYSLKDDTSTLNPGLEHLGGHYVAMSIGMDLAFDVRGSLYRTHYLAQPSWLLPGGGVKTASVNCRASPSSSAHSDSIQGKKTLCQHQSDFREDGKNP